MRSLAVLTLRLLRAVAVFALFAVLAASLVAAGPAGAATGWQVPMTPVAVTRPFAPPPTPYAAGHRGVDLSGTPGELVRAVADGRISYAGTLAGRGVVVVVHGALRTTYEPVRALVQRGTSVSRGEPIGQLAAGHAGCPVAACLHWGLLRGAQYLDPMQLVTRSQVRLYPPAGIAPPPVLASGQLTAATRSAAGSPTAGPAMTGGAPLGPSPVTWSLVAVAGAGVLVAARRR